MYDVKGRSSFPKKSLYLVTDSSLCLGRSLAWVVEQAILGGVDIVQYREKSYNPQKHRQELVEIRDICSAYGRLFIINDDLSLALELNADGAHIGQSDVNFLSARKILSSSKILGLSLESMDDLRSYFAKIKSHNLETKEKNFVDYFGVSPIFPTSTKLDTKKPWGLEGLQELRNATDMPLVAIGGIHLENGASIVKAGADSLAVVSAICSAKDPRLAATELKQFLI
ncbi:MAG: thiamine phosphate synthase [Leptospiraceae bacterium]|nr:thiamine phosphate synthase [Leptospiraceae bacterium]